MEEIDEAPVGPAPSPAAAPVEPAVAVSDTAETQRLVDAEARLPGSFTGGADERGRQVPEIRALVDEGILNIDMQARDPNGVIGAIVPGPNARTADGGVATRVGEIDVAASRAALPPVGPAAADVVAEVDMAPGITAALERVKELRKLDAPGFTGRLIERTPLYEMSAKSSGGTWMSISMKRG